MEEPTDATKISSESNWNISNGDLHSIINFNSSSDSRFHVDYHPKSPLILKKPISPDYLPCYVKISFSQKYEIKQVYIRSSATAFELYYASTLDSSDKYLCSTLCKTAVSDMDDWEIVNLPDSPSLDNGDTSLTANTRKIEDFYEATAEINNEEPCISLTVRFLSIRSEECLYIDEVYVSALPIEPKHSSDQAIYTVNSDGNSLIPMLVGSKTRNPTSIMNENQWSDSSREIKLDGGSQNDSTNSQMESLMEQLVLKVSNIEYLFLRFEEKIVNPMNNLEARICLVEQQVKEISLNSESIKGKAPEFNIDESRNQDFYDIEETSEQKGYTGLVTCSRSIAGGVHDREPLITLIQFHLLMQSDGCDRHVGGLQDNRTWFNLQLFAFPIEAVCSC